MERNYSRGKPRSRAQEESDFWAKVIIRSTDECWNWIGARLSVKGKPWHGVVRWGGRSRLAHRVAWTLQNGEIPDGLFVLHSCDNPICMNGKHLFTGTQTDNVADCVSKGRNSNWKKAGLLPHAKVSDEAVCQMRSRHPKETLTALAKEFGCTRQNVSMIVRRITRNTPSR